MAIPKQINRKPQARRRWTRSKTETAMRQISETEREGAVIQSEEWLTVGY